MELDDLNNNNTGELRIGVSYTRGQALLPRLLPPFHQKHPGITVTILEGSASELQENLSKGRIDLFIGYVPRDLDAFEAAEIGRERLFLVVPKPFMEELKNIKGVGAGKAQRYGAEFCQLIARYCEENEIDRFEDFRVRTLVNKSAEKVSIILAVDRQVDLDEIAKTKGLSLSELLDEIYSIVDSGTKLNLDYYINEVMDDYHMQDIYDYFREADNNDIDEALDEFADEEDEYTEEEIKLVRIKFLAENGH